MIHFVYCAQKYSSSPEQVRVLLRTNITNRHYPCGSQNGTNHFNVQKSSIRKHLSLVLRIMLVFTFYHAFIEQILVFC